MRRATVIDLFSVLKQSSEAREEETLSDERLVARALQGDRWADEAIYRKHAHFVGSLSGRLLRSRADAEDVVQDTFTLALTELPKLREPERLRSWLAQITVSQVRRRFRRRRLLSLLRMDHSFDEVGFENCASPDASPELRAMLAELDGVVASLPLELRIAWMLRFVEGEQLADIACATGCSLATVKRRLMEADAKVRAHVELEEVPS